jgi:2-phosphosulfolactate phosphatase
MIEFQRVDLSGCPTATGLVIAIDVIRAFTTASYLFGAGVSEILLVSTLEEAFDLRERFPGSLLCGEVKGLRPAGFDLGNSPAALAGLDLAGKRVIQRTSAGTQAVARLQPAQVTFVLTGLLGEGYGDEDAACADALEALLRGQPVDWDAIHSRVRTSKSAAYFDGSRPDFPPADLERVLAVDAFDFALRVERAAGLHILQPEWV